MRERKRERERERQREREKDRERERKTERERERETDRQTDTHTDRQTDRDRDRQRDRKSQSETDSQRDTDRQVVGGSFAGCLPSQQQASVSQVQICSDNFTCCYTEIEVADQTFYLTQSQYADIGPTSPSADSITPAPGRAATGVPIFKSLV